MPNPKDAETVCTHCGREHAPGTRTCPNTGQATSVPGLIGKTVDRYAVEGLLGSGGFGNVYRARHLHTDAKVALKVLKPQLGADHDALQRFLREAKAATAVGNPHIVRVLDANSVDGHALIAFELLDGWDLKELAIREGPLSVQRIVELICQALDGLAAAHAKGVVHRDIKPANVFVVRERPDGTEGDFVKLLDFGISKFQSDATNGLTATGVAIGTPSYMAPEQFFDAKSVDARADLYSMAVMLYELLGGRLPHVADSYAEVVVKTRTETPPPLASLNPRLPPALAAVVDRGLSKEKAKRFETAKEMSTALRAAVGSAEAAAPAPVVAPANLATPSGGRFLLGGPQSLRLDPTARPAAPPVGLAAPAALAPTASSARTAPMPAKPKSSPAVWIIIAIIVFFASSCIFGSMMSGMTNVNDSPPRQAEPSIEMIAGIRAPAGPK